MCAREYEPSPRTGLMPFAACRNLQINRLARTTTPFWLPLIYGCAAPPQNISRPRGATMEGWVPFE